MFVIRLNNNIENICECEGTIKKGKFKDKEGNIYEIGKTAFDNKEVARNKLIELLTANCEMRKENIEKTIKSIFDTPLKKNNLDKN